MDLYWFLSVLFLPLAQILTRNNFRSNKKLGHLKHKSGIWTKQIQFKAVQVSAISMLELLLKQLIFFRYITYVPDYIPRN